MESLHQRASNELSISANGRLDRANGHPDVVRRVTEGSSPVIPLATGRFPLSIIDHPDQFFTANKLTISDSANSQPIARKKTETFPLLCLGTGGRPG